MSVLVMPARTYAAHEFFVAWEGAAFFISGRLDGGIDLAVPGGGTFPLSVEEARFLADALQRAAADVEANCLFERDALLMPCAEDRDRNG